MRTFELEIISPAKVVFKGKAQSVVVPAYEGKLGILGGHAPMVAQLKPGEIKVDGTVLFIVSDGFAEITQKRMRLFVEAAEEPADFRQKP